MTFVGSSALASLIRHFSFQLRFHSSFRLRLFATSAFASLIFICLFFLDINDVYKLDVLPLKRTSHHDYLILYPQVLSVLLPFIGPRSFSHFRSYRSFKRFET